MIHVRINLHANNMVNVAINDNGDVVRQAKLPCSQQSLEDFFGTFSEPVQAIGIG